MASGSADSALTAPLMSASDPFYAVRDALEAEVQSLRVKFEEWHAQLHIVNTATDAGFREKHAAMGAELKKAEEFCGKVRLAVVNVERNRAKFPHIDDRELATRRGFVDRLTASVHAMRQTYGSPETNAKLHADRQKLLVARQAAEVEAASKASSAYTKANSDFLRDQASAQAQIRREQDATLDKMSGGLETLAEMAVVIESELQDQGKMIDDVDSKMDEAQGKLDHAIKAIEKLLKTKDRCQIATILILVVIFIIVTAIAVM